MKILLRAWPELTIVVWVGILLRLYAQWGWLLKHQP